MHDTPTRQYFEPESFDDIKDAGTMKTELKSMAREMSAGKIGTFTTKMVKCFGGDRSGGGVDSSLEINASSNTSAIKATAPSGALAAAVAEAAAIEGAGKMLRFVSSSSNCIGYSVANLLDGVDVAAADAAANWPARVAFTTKVFMGKGTVDTFIAQLDGVKCKGTSGKKASTTRRGSIFASVVFLTGS